MKKLLIQVISTIESKAHKILSDAKLKELDPNKRAKLEQKLSQLEYLARKYKGKLSR